MKWLRRALLIQVFLSVTMPAQTNSSEKLVDMSFTVIGIACRTSNAKEASGQGCIGRQWGRLVQEHLLDKIPERVDKSAIAVYTEYASDKDGEYTYVLGAKVKADAVVPAGMVKTTISAGRYAMFTSDRGPVQQVVVDTWKRIWSAPKDRLGGDRAYKSDFEIYDERAIDPSNAQIDIFIGVR